MTLTVFFAVFLLALVWALFVARRRHRVFAQSAALKQLGELNSHVKASVRRQPTIRHSFHTAVNSKAKFDRFDLPALMARDILGSEQWFQQEIGARVEADRLFSTYCQDFEALASRSLGKSAHPRVHDKRFVTIEQKVFHRRKLAKPVPKAKIRNTVCYTSPKGKNSYSCRLEWNFAQLNAGLKPRG